MFGTRLGLDSTRRLLNVLDDPQRRMAVVLVAGTNGKGSTAAVLASIVSAAGYRAGLYTSPHLERVHERIRVDGVSIAEPDLQASLRRVVTEAERIADSPVTYFEALTVAALVHFAASGVELAVLEVGLGGRLDATNASEPALSLITEIGLDHREHLGETLAEIAREKAGILRPDRPALAWVTEIEARGAIERSARALGARLRFASDSCRIEPREGPAADRTSIELETDAASYTLSVSLAGRHQLSNVALAVAAGEDLAAAGWSRVDHRAVVAGVAACRWPGRLEWVRPDSSAPDFLLDGAHNPAAIDSLRSFLSAHVKEFTLIFGALRDKEVGRMLRPLASEARRVIVTAPRSRRAVDPGALAALIPETPHEVAGGVGGALDAALGSGEPVVVTGSLYLVGEARAELTRRFGVPTPAAELSTYDPQPGSPADAQ
jgi:dihydrofolate synthase/folylpolyglutamate synthase